MNIDNICLSVNSTLLEAMKTIDRSTLAVAVVCENGIVQGVLTDGDLRRAIINGVELSSTISPYYTSDYVSVSPGMLRTDVLDIMQARYIEQIPVVDKLGKLVGIHTMHSILGGAVKPNRAIIMAGGKGVRLGSLTKNTPKPMLRVAGKPILERLVLHLVHYGVRKIYISVNYLSNVIEDHFEDGSRFGCEIKYIREDKPLGTGGALSLLPEKCSHSLIVMNGDLIMEADISQMLHYHETNEFYATMGVHHYTHEVPYGCVEVREGQIDELREKPLITKCVNAGFYILSQAAVADIPLNEFFPITKLFELGLAHGMALGAYPFDGDWADVGLPDQLKQVRCQI